MSVRFGFLAVTPAKLVLDSDRGAGAHKWLISLDFRFQGNDNNGSVTFYMVIMF